MSGVAPESSRAHRPRLRERDFARAAGRLHVAPPTLTASIEALQRRVGLRSFDRSVRAVAPTAREWCVPPLGERVLDGLDRARAERRDEARLRAGSAMAAGAASA